MGNKNMASESNHLKITVIFLYIAKTSSGCKLIHIEHKTRCGSNTEALARLSARFNLNKHVSMKWDNPTLQKNTTSHHELAQLLRHAAVYDSYEVLLLVGFRSATILQGVVIEYDNAIN